MTQEDLSQLKGILGTHTTARVVDENADFVFAQLDGGHTVRINKSELNKIPRHQAQISGLVYLNHAHQLQMTKADLKVGIDRYAWGTVVNVRHDLGVFVDVGLPDKDVAVSLDDLPTMPSLWPKRGDKLLISLTFDEKMRMWGKLADDHIIAQVSKRASTKMKNKNVIATVYHVKQTGTLVLTTDYQLGFIHPSERIDEPRLGQELSARVIGINEHGGLNLSLRPRAYEAIDNDALMILTALKHAGGSLAFNDHSSPAAIKMYFGISKGQFKRALGALLKQKKVAQTATGIKLITPSDC